MRILSVIKKSLLEQTRNFWILILTITLAPFFVAVYYMIEDSYDTSYRVAILNQDMALEDFSQGAFRFSDELINTYQLPDTMEGLTRLEIRTIKSREEGLQLLKDKNVHLVLVLPPDFSSCLLSMTGEENSKVPDIEFMGDLTNMDYLVAAIWVEDFLYRFIYEVTAFTHPFNFKETSIGTSGKMSTDFQVYVPGLILVGIIMLLFTSAIALVGESERRTLNRLKLSNLSTLEFIGGVCFVQVLLGLLSVALTLAVAFAFGFDPQGSWGLFLFVIVLASISMIAFGVIVAAFTRTVNAVLIVGNFPLFLFMFFTGAFFPMHANELFSVAGYKITIISLLSPSHAVEALKKVMLFQEGLMGILPEVISIILLTVLYLSFGLWAFKWRHMRAD